MYVHESGPVQGPVVVFLHGDGTTEPCGYTI